MADYHQIKNAAILTPTGSTDLGSDSNRYSNVFMSGNIVLNNSVVVTSNNAVSPRITSITYPGNDTAADIAGGQTITITGTNFNNAGGVPTVIIGTTVAPAVSYISSTSLTFTTPALSAGTYLLTILHSDGAAAIFASGISYSGTPSWTNAAGSLGTVYETANISTTLTASGDVPITYSVVSGTLPTGSTLDSSTGLISGTTSSTDNSTTYNFTIKATDAQNQDTNRAFSLTISPDIITWNSPADGTSTALGTDIAMTNFTMSATSAAGKSITYTANSLPTGLSITGANIVGTPTVVANTSTLITATASTTNRTATRTFNWVVSVASDPYFKNTTLLLSGNGTNNLQNNTFLDGSTNNFAITSNGNATQGTFSPYGSNWSLYTNGTNSYAYLPYSATRSIGTGDFSIECWVYIAKQPQNYTRIWSHQSNYGLAGSIGVELGLGTVDTLIQTLIDGNSQVYTGATYDTSGTSGSGHVRQWIHVVSSRQNGYLRLFVNGILREASASSTNINGTSTTSFGTNSQLGGDLTELYISNFRMCIGSVPTLYSTTSTTAGTTIFTPPTSPATVTSQGASNVTLLLFQSNRLVDNSPYNFAITTVSNPSIQVFGPFGSIPEAVPISYSNYFDGTGDYLTTPSSANFTFPADFTIECWIYVPSISRTIQRIFSSNAGPSGACYFSVGNDIGTGAGAGKLCANGHLVSPYSAGLITASTAIPINTWIHAALVRSGSTITIYQDGVSVASATDSATWDFNNSAGVRISGTPWAGSSEDFGGYMSNLRIVKGTAVYTTTFTPSTTPLTAIANTSLLTCQSTTMIDNSTNAFTITAAGNTVPRIFNPFGYTAQTSTSYSPTTHGGSAYFDGTGDYLSIPSNSAFQFGTGDFTIECWFYDTGTSDTYPGIISSINGWQSGSTALRFNNTGNRKFGFFHNPTGDPIFSSTNTFSSYQWYHVAVTRSGTSMKMFVNGVQEASATVSASISLDTTTGVFIGSGFDGSSKIKGYVSNVRVVKGTAVYTGNFTPPTAPVTAISGTSLLTNFANAGIIDNTMINNLETVGDAKISTAQSKFGGSSIYLDGTGDYCFLPNTHSFLFSKGDFTIESWVYISDTSTRKYILGPGTDTASHFKGFGLEIYGQQLSMWASSNGTGWDILECDTAGNRGATLLAINTWYHVAVSRSGSTFRSFVNGVVEKTFTSSATIFSDTTIPYNIGRTAYQSGNFYYNGYMDDLRITKGYARYTGTFTPPTSALITK